MDDEANDEDMNTFLTGIKHTGQDYQPYKNKTVRLFHLISLFEMQPMFAL